MFPIEIPPLRERPLDIEPLAQRILQAAVTNSRGLPYKITREAITKLCRHSWPGNVRELENVLQRAAILATDAIEVEHINLPSANVHDIFSNETKKNTAETQAEPQTEDIKTLERKHILETLAAVNGSRKLAVKKLGISERTLRYKLQQYRLMG